MPEERSAVQDVYRAWPDDAEDASLDTRRRVGAPRFP